MIILGVDPGIATTGYGLIEAPSKLISYGEISTGSKDPFPERLEKIFEAIMEIAASFKPEEMAVEKVFFAKNAKTAINVSQARGVVLLAGVKSGLSIFEYTPLEIKLAITGFGQAGKDQVEKMVVRLLNLKEPPKPDDAADALACALCHIHSVKMRKLGV